jgi:hypothetical protein
MADAKATLPRTVSIGLTEKAYETVVAEATCRKINPERLRFVALFDYLGRHGKTTGAETTPLIFHVRRGVRKKIVEAAKAAGVSPNAFMISGALKAIEATRSLLPDAIRASTNSIEHPP